MESLLCLDSFSVSPDSRRLSCLDLSAKMLWSHEWFRLDASIAILQWTATYVDPLIVHESRWGSFLQSMMKMLLLKNFLTFYLCSTNFKIILFYESIFKSVLRMTISNLTVLFNGGTSSKKILITAISDYNFSTTPKSVLQLRCLALVE